jgi:hypothetical protein
VFYVQFHTNKYITTKTGLALSSHDCSSGACIAVKGTLNTCRKSHLQRNRTYSVEALAVGRRLFTYNSILIRM